MTSILVAATLEKVEDAYRVSGALPRRRISIYHSGADLYACPIVALALAARPVWSDWRTIEIPDALEAAGIDDDAAADGFVDGFDELTAFDRTDFSPGQHEDYRAGVALGVAISRAVFAE